MNDRQPGDIQPDTPGKEASDEPSEEQSGPRCIRLSLQAAHRLVDAVPGRDLYEFIKVFRSLRKDCFHGFRVTLQNADNPVVRSRLSQELSRHPDLAGAFLEFPRMPWENWVRAISALRTSWLREYWRELLAADANPILPAAALAIDSRTTVRGIGERVLRRRGFWEKSAGKKPSTSMSVRPPSEWRALAEVSRYAAPGRRDAPGGDEDETKTDATLRKQMAALKREHRQLKHRFEHAQKKWEDERSALEQRRRELEKERRDLRRRLEEAHEKLETERRERERRIRAEVLAERRRLLGLAGLPEDLSERAETAAGEADALIERVQQVLAKQREINEGYDACSRIRDQIRRLEEARQAIADCRRESLVVVPALAAVESDVQKRIEELRSLLVTHRRDASDESSLAAMFLEEIESAPLDESGIDALDELTDLLRISRLRSRLGDTVARRIEKAVARRREQIERVNRERRLAELAGTMATDDSPSEPDEAEAEDLRRLVKEGLENVLVIVDGYNVTKHVRDLAAVEEQMGLAESRHRLIELCRRRLAPLNVLLVFDGQGALGTHESHGNVQVAFAPQRQDAHNADDLIAARVQEEAGCNRVCWVVTLDRDLRRRCARNCDRFMTPQAFYEAMASRS